jgi:glycosyltransferase involved in cell wall biosynthesis
MKMQDPDISPGSATEQGPAVSVIIPTYNRADHVGRGIRSVLTQTFQDFEVLIVDDGSTDKSEEIVRGFNDSRILYLRRDTNGGAAAARNTGIQAARGEYIAFLDSDDEWLPEKLEKQLAKFKSIGRSAALIYTHMLLKDLKTGMVFKPTNPSYEGYVHDLLLRNDFIGSCSSVLIRTDVIKCLGGFDDSLTPREDWELWMRIAREYSIGCVPSPLLICHIGGVDRMSASLKKILKGTRLVLDKHSDYMKKLPKAYGKHLAAMAQIELNYDRTVGWRTAAKAFRVYSFQPKLLAALCLSLFGKTLYRKIFSEWGKFRGDLYVGQASI